MISTNTTVSTHPESLNDQQEVLLNSLREACKKIAPVWSLENSVAVNPYLGHTHKKFTNVAKDLAAAGGIQMTLPPSFYLEKIREGIIKEDDLAWALTKSNSKADPEAFLRTIENKPDLTATSRTIASLTDTATQVTGKDWNRFVTARISNWAASYFDAGQAIWSAANQQEGLFQSWKSEAQIDFTPEIAGLKGFRKIVRDLPDNPLEAAQASLDKLGIPSGGLALYLHRILLRVGGWSAYAALLDWESELYDGKDGKLIEFLTILICWEACLLQSLDSAEVNENWEETKKLYASGNVPKHLNQELAWRLILQEAYDYAAQRDLLNKFQKHELSSPPATKVSAQAIFCIDVRSEVYRRNLESVDSSIETLGFAGFFAFPIKYLPIGNNDGEAQCPALLKTGPTILEKIPDEHENEKALNSRLGFTQIQQAWKSFKSGALTCFSFVSPVGLSYLPKLFTDSFGLTRPVPDPKTAGIPESLFKKKTIGLTTSSHGDATAGIPLQDQVQMAKNALTAMSLSDDFARFVLLVGHGSTTVNNPHATGYDCGACGGHSGEANARVAAAVLNNREVRSGLQKENIFIPVDTVFLACLHDTTTDEVQIFNEDDVPDDGKAELAGIKRSLKLAGQAARKERYPRLPSEKGVDIDKSIFSRSKDWSQIRPEWGLAGCSTFVVAPRNRTKNINLEGKSFLHSYEWKKDQGFAVLELIMTAPMVVTSWINLQYYGSTVDNKNHGSGNKTLHNVTAGLGVLEGYSGDLRVGLPFQSIHDGEKYQHEPHRLTVIIEAPTEAMNIILEKHKSVRDLCDNGWLHLMAMDDNGNISKRYSGNMSWEKVD